MPQTTAQLKHEIQELRGRYDQILADYQGRDVPEHVVAQLDEMDQELEDKLEAYSEVAQREKRADSNREAMMQIFGQNGPSDPADDGDQRQAKQKPGSLGEFVMSDPAFRAWHETIAPDGRVPSRDRRIGVSPAVELDAEFHNLMMGALITGADQTSAGAFVTPDRSNIVVPYVREELTLLDLVSYMTTASDAVEFVRVNSETNNAAGVPEATNLDTGQKPQSDMDFQVVITTVKTMAHWIAMTKRSLADARQVEQMVNQFLLFGLRQLLNGQLVNGDGDGENLTGIANTSGIQTQAFDTDILATTRKARTLMRLNAGSGATAYAMNPVDWERIDLLTDNENRYYFGGPSQMGVRLLWGVPVVESEQIPEGTAYLGNWRQAVIWDREQASIQVSDSHADFFTKNLVAILAEMRAAFGVLQPKAFVEIDLTEPA